MAKNVRNQRSIPGFGNVLSMDAETVGMLVRSAQQGNLKSFERLYRLHCGKVYGLCLRMMREPDAAEDCAQQTFIQAWRNLNNFEHRSAFSSWLHGIAVNAVLSHKRSNKAWVQFDTLDSDDESRRHKLSDTERPIDAGDLMDVERALKKLPDGARYVLVLQALYGYSHEEVARMLGIAVGTCKAQLHRARRILRHQLNFSEDGDA